MVAQSKPTMYAFLSWLKDTKPLTVPKSKAYEAVNYALNQLPYLENILLDGRLELTDAKYRFQPKPRTY
ncbi:IS66 family transposase [Desulfosporosinus sp. SYSU MS00001]|uniref:IS66 family transposase n=1 Tax=Desulfosporosinus sp. SYSU MS00001 TaxID=3416284 RepID=UPI003CEF3BDE